MRNTIPTGCWRLWDTVPCQNDCITLYLKLYQPNIQAAPVLLRPKGVLLDSYSLNLLLKKQFETRLLSPGALSCWDEHGQHHRPRLLTPTGLLRRIMMLIICGLSRNPDSSDQATFFSFQPSSFFSLCRCSLTFLLTDRSGTAIVENQPQCWTCFSSRCAFLLSTLGCYLSDHSLSAPNTLSIVTGISCSLDVFWVGQKNLYRQFWVKIPSDPLFYKHLKSVWFS